MCIPRLAQRLNYTTLVVYFNALELECSPAESLKSHGAVIQGDSWKY